MQVAFVQDSGLVVPRRFRLVEYHRLLELGVLSRDERLELLEGVIAERTPAGLVHARALGRLELALGEALPEGARVWRQQPLPMGEDSEPVPDLALTAGSEPGRPLVVVEVAEDSLLKDRELKGRIYARGGVPEYWVVDLAGRAVEVYTSPEPGSGMYQALCSVRAHELLTSLLVPRLEVTVRSLWE